MRRAPRLWATLAVMLAAAGGLILLVPRSPHDLPKPLDPPHSYPAAACRTADRWTDGQTQRVRLDKNEARVFRLVRERREVLDLEVHQHAMDATVYLWSPQGRLMLEVRGINRRMGTERVFAVADRTGSYCLEVFGSDERGPGSFDVRAQPPRTASTADARRAAAHRALSQAEQLQRNNKHAPAIPLYEGALADCVAVRDADGVRLTRFRLGDLYGNFARSAKEKDKSLRFLQAAAAAYAGLPEQARVLNRLSNEYESQGYSELALQTVLKAQAVARQFQDDASLALVLGYLGRLRARQGELDAAMKTYEQVLRFWRLEGNRTEEGIVQASLADLYLNFGLPERALAAAREAVDLAHGRGDLLVEERSRRSLGMAYQRTGDAQAALAEFQRAIALQEALGDIQGEAGILLVEGDLYREEKAAEAARRAYEKALALAGTNPKLAARVYHGLGKLLWQAQDLPHAREALLKARDFYTQSADNDVIASVLLDLAQVVRQEGHLGEARELARKAIELIEPVRAQAASGDLRTAFFSFRAPTFDFAIDLLMELDRQQPRGGFAAEAFGVNEKARARVVLDELAEASRHPQENPELRRRRAELSDRLAALDQEFARLPAADAGSALGTAAREGLRARTYAVQSELDLLEAPARTSRQPSTGTPPPLSLAEVQRQVLDPDTVLLAYKLGEKRSFLWLVRQDSMESYELPAGKFIEASARAAYKELSHGATSGGGERLAIRLAELSTQVLGQVEGKLGRSRLLVVADGALRSIPFAALPVGGHPLVIDHEIVSVPSASVLASLRRPLDQMSSQRLLVFADPVFGPDDERLPAAVRRTAAGPAQAGLELEPLERLSGTQVEATAILKLVQPGKGRLASGFEANLALATSPELADYGILHFATHALFDPEHPDLSAIVLSRYDRNGQPRNGYLRAYEIYNLRLPVDLVVLSACETARDREETSSIRSEGLSGLTRGFLYAGAPRVVVSLWSVSDKGTAELMAAFYQRMLQRKLSPAAALRAAQIELLESRDWHSPYYWAAFTLQGQWR